MLSLRTAQAHTPFSLLLITFNKAYQINLVILFYFFSIFKNFELISETSVKKSVTTRANNLELLLILSLLRTKYSLK